MKKVTVIHTPEGDLDIRHLPPALGFALRELPGLLSDDFPESTSRITQDPVQGLDQEANDEASEEWVRNGHPELRHLFESARELVTADLAGLKLEGFLPPLYRLRIPGPNLTAWLSALAAARVGLGEAHAVTPADLERAGNVLRPNERDRGILIIQLLGWMQAILIGDPEE